MNEATNFYEKVLTSVFNDVNHNVNNYFSEDYENRIVF